MNKISIIIPILNEAKNIEFLLNYLLENSFEKNISEIIVVDGGSTDGSQNIIDNFTSGQSQSRLTKTTLLNSEKGRAKQMNFGAKHATGNILYFLHADSFPPKNFDQLIIGEVKKGNYAGCFAMKFDSELWWLKLAGWFTKFNWKVCRGGDQSLFITKWVFENIGGYNEQYIIYEDNEIISKLYKINEFVVIKKWLKTSARRYKSNGVWRLQYHFWIIHLKKRLGSSAENLNNYYKKHIS